MYVHELSDIVNASVEIVCIMGKQLTNVIDLHRCYDVSDVNLFATNTQVHPVIADAVLLDISLLLPSRRAIASSIMPAT